MAIDEIQLARLRDRFTNEFKKIDHIIADRRALTSNLNKRAEYRDKISIAFNNICSYLIHIYHRSSKTDDKLECVARITPYLDKCKKAFAALKLNYNWPTIELTLIDLNAIQSLDVQLPQPVTSTVESQPSTSTQNQSEIASSTVNSEQFLDANETDDSRLDDIIHELSGIDIESTGQAQTDNIDPIDQTVQQNAANESEQNTSENLQTRTNPNSNPNSNSGSRSNLSQNSNSNPSSNNSSRVNSYENLTMPQTKNDFIKMAGNILNYKYDGDPLLRDNFIEDVELVVEMTEDEHKALCLKFIKSRITGRAREYLPENIQTVADITKELTDKIKADNSAVIAGRLTALRVNKGNFTKFAEEAEKLADAFRRSLISEGFTKTKADEQTVLETKKLCRRTARSDVVKGIIASTSYKTPADVIASLITETDTVRKEKNEQESFQKRRNDNKNKNYSNKSGRFNKQNKNGQNKQKYQKSQNTNHKGGKGRNGGRNDHVIRIVSDAGASTSTEDTNNAEQVFRLAQS
jgi:hypothetical protein